ALAVAVILGADQHQRTAPQAAGDLEVPLVPALVRHDKIFLRNEEAHEAAQQRLLVVARLAPVGEIEGARPEREARLLDRLAEAAGGLGRARLLQAPFEALV